MGTLIEYKFDDNMEVDSVSIQLMSPASGDKILCQELSMTLKPVSIQLMSPASGDYCHGSLFVVTEQFPFN